VAGRQSDLFPRRVEREAVRDKGAIRVVSPPQTLRFTHWSDLSGVPDVAGNHHVVTFDLTPAGRRTKVTLTQENSDDKPVDAKEKQDLMTNWTAILRRLQAEVEVR
jgi:hypothetical protein